MVLQVPDQVKEMSRWAGLTFGVIPASCLKCWLILAVFLAMLWVLRRLIFSLMLSSSVFLYLSAGGEQGQV